MYLRKALLLLCGVSLLATAGFAGASSPVVTAAPAAAQVVASGGTKVHGVVTDPTGALIPGASIVFTPAHGAAARATSGSDGTYHLNLAPGAYRMKVSMQGFAAYSVEGLTVPAVASTTMDVKLQLGEQSQVVNVNANSIHLSVDPDNNADSTIITGKALDALSDDPDELESELTALAGPSAGPNGGQIYVDGFTGGQLPPKSSIREIRINQNPFSAEYDKLGYGRIEVFTKPGTDKLHGNLQFNFNPSQFNDGNPLSTTYQPPYHTDFLFGNLTGPLNKNASYNLGGSFRQIQDDEFTNAEISALPSAPTVLCAPGATGCVETPYQVSTHYPQIRGDINPRVDLALGQKNVLTIRYQYVNNSSTNGGVGDYTLPTAAINSSSLSNILQVSDTQTFNPRVINETRFEYEREHTAENSISNAPTVTVPDSFTSGGNSGQNNSDHQDHFEVQNYTSIQLKKNFIRMGGRLRTTREALNNGSNTNGQFIYSGITYNCPIGGDVPGTTTPCATTTTGQGTSADNSYLTGSPTQFTYTVVNNHDIGDTYADLGLYLETDWKPIQNLTVSYGIRYETQNHLSDHHDIAPRVSVSYGLGGKGSPSVVLHGGFGIFYDRFSQGDILTLEEQKPNGTNESVYTVANPTCAPPAPGQAITPSEVAACGAGPSSATSPTIYTATSNLRTPYIQQEAIGVDKQVGSYGKISVNYIHSQGVHQLATQNIHYGLPTPEYQYFSEGVFNQNQMVVHANVAAARWLSLFGYYSLNSAHGDTSGNGSDISTPGNIAADYGRTTFDVRNRLFLAGSITMPHYFQLSPFMVGQSGNPYNITTGSDNNHDTFFNDRPVLAPGLAPNNTATSAGTIQSIPGCGTFAQPGTPGASATVAPINACTGPALFTFNFRLTKTIGFGANRNAPTNDAGPGGGGPGGDHHHGGGGHGGGGGMFGGGANTGRHYNLSFGLQMANVFANHDYATPNGVLSSLNFGKSQQLNSGFYTTNSALRRISVQASLTF